MGSMNALNLGDITNVIRYKLRPYEVIPGETDRAIEWVVDELSRFLRDRPVFEILERSPRWLAVRLARQKKWKDILNTLGKVREHLYGKPFIESLRRCRARLGKVEIDRLRVKPIVKVTGEFWAQLAEGDGNFNMFSFLEREGAQVSVDSIGNWVMYLLHQAKANAKERKNVDAPHAGAAWWEIKKLLWNELHFQKKWTPLTLGERIWARQYERITQAFGHIADPLLPQKELARLAHPFYHSLARGGEGHLEVGKNVYYNTNRLCHMVLALKPFACMPSSQSDGVQSAVVNHFPEMIFLPIETAGEGEINAHSRVQMALTEAKAKAWAEFDQCIATSRVRPEDIRDYVAEHPELRSPLYRIHKHPGVAGVAANFVLHVARKMKSAPQKFALQAAVQR